MLYLVCLMSLSLSSYWSLSLSHTASPWSLPGELPLPARELCRDSAAVSLCCQGVRDGGLMSVITP